MKTPLKIIFQSEKYVVLDKPAEVLTVPSRFEKDDHRIILGRELQKFLNQQVYPVHRLDYEVSGVVVFALREDAQRKLSLLFEKRQISKTYQAISSVQQDFAHWPAQLPRETQTLQPQTRFLWTGKIVAGKKRSFIAEHGDLSETGACLIKTDEFKSYWELQPLTGRRHQLRLEMSRRGYPILGDQLYGSRIAWSHGIALRAMHLKCLEKVDGLPEEIAAEGLWK